MSFHPTFRKGLKSFEKRPGYQLSIAATASHCWTMIECSFSYSKGHSKFEVLSLIQARVACYCWPRLLAFKV